MRSATAALVLLALAACPPGSPQGGDAGTDGGGSSGGLSGSSGGGGGLAISTINPTHGPLAGGTPIALAGSGFAPSMTVSFGGAAAQGFQYISADKATAVTPPGADAGPVDVTLTLAAPCPGCPPETATRHDGFTYDPSLQIGYCILQSPPSLAAAPDAATGLAYGRVYIKGVTDGAGNQGELLAQVGWGAAGSTPDGSWTWFNAAFNPQCNGCGNNYEYQGSLQTGAPGSYGFAYRFSANQGQSWVACDTAGDAPYQPAKEGVLTVTVPDGGADGGLAIAWCDLQAPRTLNAPPGAQAGPTYGQVWVPGFTDQGGNPAEIAAEVGYGPTGSSPANAGWSWFSAAFNQNCSDCSGGHNYEYDTSFPAPGPGSYALAYRFAFEDGGWVDCDTLGIPYDPSNAGVLTVEVPDAGPGLSIGWCDLQFPHGLDAGAGGTAGPVYGQVFVAGFTTDGGDPTAIAAQVGYGPTGSDPAGAGWSWTSASFNTACTDCNGGHNYEYDTTFTAPGPGSYALAYRFAFEDGGWVDCDTLGIPYAPANEGLLEVSAADAGVDAGPDAGAVPIPWCDLQYPAVLAIEPGAPSGGVFAQVYSPGITSASGNQGDFLAEVGYGPAGSDPADGGWTWSPAAFNPSCTTCNGANYEYEGSFTAPALGAYALAARFSGDQGASWTDCGTNPPGVPYGPSNAGTLTVRWRAVGWCNLQYPPTLTGSPTVDAGLVYGRVYQAGVTDDGGSPSAILAEVGLGPAGSDPTDSDAGWIFWPSAFNPSCAGCGGKYEYQGWIVPPAAGTYDYVTRFSVDDGGYWTACGLGGPWSPDGGNDAGLLSVP